MKLFKNGFHKIVFKIFSHFFFARVFSFSHAQLSPLTFSFHSYFLSCRCVKGGKVRDVEGWRSDELGLSRLHLAHDLQPCMLCHRNDAHQHRSLRSWPLRHHFQAQPSWVWSSSTLSPTRWLPLFASIPSILFLGFLLPYFYSFPP